MHSAQAEEMADQIESGRDFLGAGYLLVNDAFGDEYDRWRTGSAVASLAFGPSWEGQAPASLGDLLELRVSGEILAPSSIRHQRSWDRRYATAVSLGLHSHIQRGGLEAIVGADLVAIGPMTNLDEIQSYFHRKVSFPLPSEEVLSQQIQNTWRLRGVVEVGTTLDWGSLVQMRPFAELRTGDEALARAGFDLTLGNFGQGELLVRDSVTGHRFNVVRNQQPGWSFVVGADAAVVASSVYLPEVNGLEREDVRVRARAGVHWRGEKHHLFYGVSWLGKEFEAQPETQLVGAVSLTYQF